MTTPEVKAHVINPVRLRTPIRVRIAAKWPSTVRTDMPSLHAICRAESPSIASRRTWACRSVNSTCLLALLTARHPRGE